MNQLTDKQQLVFDYIRQTIEERGVAPSVREIAKAAGYRSTSTVQYVLDKLEEYGYIQRDPMLKRTIRIQSHSGGTTHVPLVGTVTAGQPILAVESIEEYISVPLKSGAKDYFALRVKGDSMIKAAILEGDIVVVERTPVADNGDIVVALIDNEATVKRFFKENGGFRLQPENDDYSPIIVDELALLGKVKMVIRNY
ncbi:MAG: transcriptional repressor LexA [Eubacteriales bacterium]|nr:transcriptional repressor LexA [Eubacteriales bacterium]